MLLDSEVVDGIVIQSLTEMYDLLKSDLKESDHSLVDEIALRKSKKAIKQVIKYYGGDADFKTSPIVDEFSSPTIVIDAEAADGIVLASLINAITVLDSCPLYHTRVNVKFRKAIKRVIKYYGGSLPDDGVDEDPDELAIG